VPVTSKMNSVLKLMHDFRKAAVMMDIEYRAKHTHTHTRLLGYLNGNIPLTQWLL